MSTAFDDDDVNILSHIQQFGRKEPASITYLAEKIDKSTAAIHARLKKLRDTGVMRSYGVILDKDALGIGIISYVSVTLANHGGNSLENFEITINGSEVYANIVECCAVTGDFDYLLKVVASDWDDYSKFIRDVLLKTPNVAHINSMVVLNEVKYTTELPLKRFRRTKIAQPPAIVPVNLD